MSNYKNNNGYYYYNGVDIVQIFPLGILWRGTAFASVPDWWAKEKC